MALPEVLRNRDFDLYWFGLVASQIGTRATSVANLYLVYELTDSIPLTGLVGLFQGCALLLLSPLGGAYADRVNRRRLLQTTQAIALAVALALTVLSVTGQVQVWHVLVSVVLIASASAFEAPARQALIPALVPRQHLAQAFSLVNPTRELAFLTGPSLAGVLIALDGVWLVYALDAATYAVLILVLTVVRTSTQKTPARDMSLWTNIRQGLSFLRSRPLILQLIGLDLSCTLFGAYRVVLPALALNVLHVGPAGYGLLSSAPSAGAVLATYFIFRVVRRSRRLGFVILVATAGFGAAVITIAQASSFIVALSAAALVGAFDAMATSIRHAAVQLQTPDELRGRVSSIYQMASRGGPSLGDANVGLIAGLLGPVLALSIGGAVPVAYAGILLLRRGSVATYKGTEPAPDVPPPLAEPPDQEPVEPGDAPGGRSLPDGTPTSGR